MGDNPSMESLHSFRDKKLRRLALTHASAGAPHNERLEWLGDALIDFLAGSMLYARYPNLPEGTLSYARANMVCGKTLAALARKFGLPPLLILSAAESRRGGRGRDSILAGALEAYFAAVYLDGGMEAAQKAAAVLFGKTLDAIGETLQSGGAFKDGKTRLQEYLQKRRLPPPQYAILERGKIANRPYCAAECRAGEYFAAAVAGNKREAEQAAGACLLAAMSA